MKECCNSRQTEILSKHRYTRFEKKNQNTNSNEIHRNVSLDLKKMAAIQYRKNRRIHFVLEG